MRDHDEVFRRVMQAKEQYEQQKKEKSMFRFMKSAPGGGASDEREGRREPSKAFVWVMRVAASLVCIAMIGGIIAAAVLSSKGKDTKDGRVGSGESGENPTQQVSNNPTEGVTGTPHTESGTLTMWSNVYEGSGMQPGFEQAIAEMKVRYPNVTLNVVAYDDDYEYKAALKAGIQDGTAPDIFYAWDGESFKDLVELGQVYCLDSVYQNYANDLPEAMCGSTTYNGKKYGVPYAFTANVLFVNMDTLRGVGIEEVPSTYEEWIACCETLKQHGIVPIGCTQDIGQEWVMSQLIEQLMLRNVGASKLEAVFRGNASWQTPGISEAIEIYKEFVQKGYLPVATDDCSYENGVAKDKFMDGKHAFYVGGNWNCPEFSVCKNEIVAVEFPVMSGTNGAAGQFLCGPVGALSVYNGSSDKELAAQYTMELGQLISKYVFLTGLELPAWKVDYNTDGVNRLNTRIAEMTQHANALVPFSDLLMSLDELFTYTDLIRRAYNGEITGAVFAASMATAAGQ